MGWTIYTVPSPKSAKALEIIFLQKLFAFYFNDIILEPKGQIYEYDIYYDQTQAHTCEELTLKVATNILHEVIQYCIFENVGYR